MTDSAPIHLFIESHFGLRDAFNQGQGQMVFLIKKVRAIRTVLLENDLVICVPQCGFYHEFIMDILGLM